MNRHKVFYVVGSLSKGGAESQLVKLAISLKKENIDVLVLAFSASLQDELLQKLRESDVDVSDLGHDFNASGFYKLTGLVRLVGKLVREIVCNKPSVLHSFLPFANFASAVAILLSSPFSNTKFFSSRRGLNTHQDGSLFWRFADKLSYKLSTTVLMNTRAIVSDTRIREGNFEKSKVIANIVEIPRSISKCVASGYTAPSHFELIIVANLIPYKGHKMLLDALALLKGLGECNFTLHAIGDDRGTLKALKQQQKELKLEEHVVWHGNKNGEEVYKMLSVASIYISASTEEGLSNSLIEAAALALPCVYTKVGGSEEIFEGASSAIGVTKEDVEQLAYSIQKIFNNYDIYKLNAMAFSKVVQARYSEKEIVKQYKEAYEIC